MTASQNSNNNRNVISDNFKHIRCCHAYYLLRNAKTIAVTKLCSNVARTRTVPTGIVGLCLAKTIHNNLSS
jgi:hypothetical protein